MRLRRSNPAAVARTRSQRLTYTRVRATARRLTRGGLVDAVNQTLYEFGRAVNLYQTADLPIELVRDGQAALDALIDEMVYQEIS